MAFTTPIGATSRKQLEELIRFEIPTHGNRCDLNHIDVSVITELSSLFDGFSKFNGEISRWDVSNATSMEAMFCGSNVKGSISGWNVENVGNVGTVGDMFTSRQIQRRPIRLGYTQCRKHGVDVSGVKVQRGHFQLERIQRTGYVRHVQRKSF